MYFQQSNSILQSSTVEPVVTCILPGTFALSPIPEFFTSAGKIEIILTILFYSITFYF